jgi:hypothetical protein
VALVIGIKGKLKLTSIRRNINVTLSVGYFSWNRVTEMVQCILTPFVMALVIRYSTGACITVVLQHRMNGF